MAMLKQVSVSVGFSQHYILLRVLRAVFSTVVVSPEDSADNLLTCNATLSRNADMTIYSLDLHAKVLPSLTSIIRS